MNMPLKNKQVEIDGKMRVNFSKPETYLSYTVASFLL